MNLEHRKNRHLPHIFLWAALAEHLSVRQSCNGRGKWWKWGNCSLLNYGFKMWNQHWNFIFFFWICLIVTILQMFFFQMLRSQPDFPESTNTSTEYKMSTSLIIFQENVRKNDHIIYLSWSLDNKPNVQCNGEGKGSYMLTMFCILLTIYLFHFNSFLPQLSTGENPDPSEWEFCHWHQQIK